MELQKVKVVTRCGPDTYCTAMKNYLQPYTCKGIVLWEFSRVTRQGPEKIGEAVGYKRSVSTRGLVFNFCPWCGNDYRISNPLLKNQGAK